MAKRQKDEDLCKACEECGSARWHLLKNGQVECAKCHDRPDGYAWKEKAKKSKRA